MLFRKFIYVQFVRGSGRFSVLYKSYCYFFIYLNLFVIDSVW